MTHIGIILTIFGAAFAVCPWTVSQYALPKSLALSLGAILIWAGILFKSSKHRTHRTPLTFPMLYLVAVVAICSAFSLDWSMSVFGSYQSYTWSLLTIVALVAVAHGVAFSKGRVGDQFIIAWFIWTAAAACVYAFFQSSGYDIPGVNAVMWKTAEGQLMPSAGFGHPVYFGSFIALVFPVALWLSLQDWPSRWTGRALVAFLLVAAVLTTKRGVFVGIGAGTLFFLWSTGRLMMDRKRIAALALVLFIGFVSYLPRLYDKGGDIARLEAWSVAVQALKDHPLLGTGPDTFSIPYRAHKTFASVSAQGSSRFVHFSAHNDVLQVAATMGLLGLSAYLFMLFGFVRTFVNARVFDAEDIHFAMMAGLVGVFVIAKVNPIPISTLMLCAVAVGFIMRLEPLPEIQGRSRTARNSLAVLAVMVPAAFFVSRAFIGDYYRKEAFNARKVDPLVMAQKANKAAKWAPWVFEIRRDQAHALFFLPMRATQEMGLKISEQAVKIGKSSIKYHPFNAEAHTLYASTLLMRQHWGGPSASEEAMEYLDKAQSMAPLFRPLMLKRSAIAKILKDRRRELSARASAQTVRRFENGGR